MSFNNLIVGAPSSNKIHRNKKELVRTLFRCEHDYLKKNRTENPISREIKYIQYESRRIRENSAQTKYEPKLPHGPAPRNHPKVSRNDQKVNREPKKKRAQIDRKAQAEAIRIQGNSESKDNQKRPKASSGQREANDLKEYKEYNKDSRAINKTSSKPEEVKQKQSKADQLIPPSTKSQPCRLPCPTLSNSRNMAFDRYHNQRQHSTGRYFSLTTVKKHRYVPQPLPGEKTISYQGQQVNYHNPTAESATAQSSACNLLVKQILTTVGELENTLFENHQHDFNLRMSLDRQTEHIHDLRSSLDNEKQRNQRLLQLVRGVDSSGTSADEASDYLLRKHNSGQHVQRWQSRTSIHAFDSISPLLLQQRFDELTASYKQCRRQLAKKERSLATSKYEKEAIRSQYDDLIDAYRQVQKRFEDLCYKYLHLQAKKNQEIRNMRDVITYASNCILTAKHIMDKSETGEALHYYNKQFRSNLQLFVKALKICDLKPRESYVHKSNAK